jgi:type II secretory pathway pseudopilin PulG
MWLSTSSSRRRGRGLVPGLARGFTLLEAMISLLLLVIILIVAMTMLFQMRAFAERQQYFMLPRQAARRATDYLSYYIAGASDLNYNKDDATRQSPNALITYYNSGGVLTQASYNNLTGNPAFEPGNSILPASGLRPANTSTAFGDIGTDTITMVAPFNPSRYQVFAPFPAASGSADLWLNFRVGCATDDAANQAAFQAATGFDGTQSALLMLVDNTGSWAYVRIPAAGYLVDGTCADVTLFKNIHIQVDTLSGTPAPPHGPAALTDPVFLVAGLQVISFRVLTDSVDGVPKLQQKLGLFDPATDNPGAAFTNVMENVEDLQIAYMYPNGAIWNTASQTLGAPGVPAQAGPSTAAGPLDIQNAIGLRFSVTGRSPLLPIGAQQLTNVGSRDDLVVADPTKTPNQHFRPASEDHTVTMDPVFPLRPVYDQFDHYRSTATLMLRNRTPKG